MREFALFISSEKKPEEKWREETRVLAEHMGVETIVHPSGKTAVLSENPISTKGDSWCVYTGFPWDPDANSGEASAEQIHEAILKGGDAGFNRFEGPLAAVITDGESARAYREPFGRRKIFAWKHGSDWVLVSEAHLFRKLPCWKTVLNPLGVESYFAFNYVPHPISIFKNSWKVPAGFAMYLPENRMVPVWKPDFEVRENATVGEAVDDSREMLKAIVKRLPEKGPGMMLSGGIDSTVLMGIFKELGRDYPALTLDIKGGRGSEKGPASYITEKLGFEHRVIPMTDEVWDLIDGVARALNEPMGSNSLPGMLYLNRECGGGEWIKGTGADNVFAGLGLHKKLMDFGKWNWIPGPVGRAFRSLCRGSLLLSHHLAGDLGGVFTNFVMRKRHSVRRKLIRSDVAGRRESRYVENYIELFIDELPTNARSSQVIEFLFVTNRLGTRSFSWNDLFKAANIKVYNPYMNKRLFEYVLKLPLDVKFKNCEQKYILRQILKDFADIDKLQSIPFALPTHEYISRYYDEIRSELCGPKSAVSEYLNVETISAWLSEHKRGKKRHRDLWPVIVFSRWLSNWK